MVFGSRNFAIGLAVLAFYWQGTYREEGLVLICCMVSDAVDTIMISLRGKEGKALAHGVEWVVLELTRWELLGCRNGRFQEV